MPAEEQRIDPEDGRAQTLAQLQRKYAGRYNKREIDGYWQTMCMSLGDGAGSRGDHSHGQRGRAAQPGEAFVDPFMAHGPSNTPSARDSGRESVRAARRQHLLQSAGALRRGWREAMVGLLGPGAPDRKVFVRSALVLGPWFLFVWMVLVWILLRHFSTQVCVLLTAAAFGACLCAIHAGRTSGRLGLVPLLPLGLLCLLAAGLGVAAGSAGWDRHWRHYWWLQTGMFTEGASASTPAASNADSAVVQFNGGGQVGRTSVDDTRSAAYKDGHFYCVAPLLDPSTAGASVASVNYWAVGLDCCSELGSFHCDASRSHTGQYGVVMLDGGFPCPGCDADKFGAAVRKAEAMHSLASAPGAMYVRVVSDVTAFELGVLLGALSFVFKSAFLGFLGFFTLGSLCWYWDIGGAGAAGGESQPLLSPKQPAV